MTSSMNGCQAGGSEAHTGTVLVVDDEVQLRVVLGTHLEHAGFDVLLAADGTEALRLARLHQPDVILMDVTMPGMSGLEVTRALHSDETTRGIPVLILTARTDSRDLIAGLEAGACEYIPKPFQMAELVARVRTMYRLSAARRELDALNERLEREVEQKTRRLKLLYEFVESLGHAETRDTVMDLVVTCVKEITGARRVCLFMADASNTMLVCERAIGIDTGLVRSIRISSTCGAPGGAAGAGSAGRLTATTEIRNPDASSGTIISGNSHFNGGGDSSGVSLLRTSLQTRDGILGMLSVCDKPDSEAFTREEEECIRSIADAATIALHNLQRRGRLEASVTVLLQTLGHLAEYRDEETTLHIKRVSRMARVLAEQLAAEGPYRHLITSEFIEHLVQAAPMHDIGKVGIPDDILNKPGTLTPEEYQIMKAHTEIGRRVLSRAVDPGNPVPLLKMCVDIAHCHHERFNGTGYPRRLKGQNIPLAARIIALVDAYDAITSHRRYSRARTHEQAVRILQEDSGTHFDPDIVAGFMRCHEQFAAIRTELQEDTEGELLSLANPLAM